MSEEELEILEELSKQNYFGDLPFLYYADLIGKLIANYNKEKEKNKELFEEYNKRVAIIIAYEQGLQEIIDAEDDPDTWAYYAVKQLLKEVGKIDYN